MVNKILKGHEDHAARIHHARDLKEIVGRLKRAESENEAIKVLKASRATFEIKPRLSKGLSEATAVACFTDLHVGNHITKAQTNGINEYNVGLAYSRSATFFERVVRLTHKERQDVKIEELILFLGGDFIDGNIHLDTIMSNRPSTPMEQVVVAQEIIESGLKYLQEKGGFKRITVVCKDGNHARMTVKMHVNSRVGNALEWYMFHNLRARFPRMNWIIEESLHSFVKVYDWTVRFHHGDTIFFGGQNGFYQNYHILINSNNAVIRADLDVTGHLHQYTPMRRYVVNGSVVGFSPYAMAISKSFSKGEPPTQAFFLIDKKRRVTVHIPILL